MVNRLRRKPKKIIVLPHHSDKPKPKPKSKPKPNPKPKPKPKPKLKPKPKPKPKLKYKPKPKLKSIQNPLRGAKRNAVDKTNNKLYKQSKQ